MLSSLSIFKGIKTVLDENHILFWLDSGSLLGYVRDGKIIEWDDDIDLASTFEPVIENIEKISTQLYNLGYDILITDVKLTIIKGDDSISLFLYKHNVIPNHIMRYRVSKKNFMAHILLYGFLEGLRTSYKDSLHNPTPKQELIYISKTLMSKLKSKQIYDLLLSFGKKIGCLFVFDITLPSSYIDSFKVIDFYGHQANIPVQSEKYLEWMYGKDWRIPNPDYEGQWDFYDVMESYNTKRELKQKLKLLTDILNKHKIHFWMYGGALLGYVRNGDLIPWDRDIDLFVWKKDYHKVLELKREFEKAGFSCSIRDGCTMLRWSDKNMTLVHYTLGKDTAFLEKLCTRNKLGNIIYYGALCKTLEYNMTHLTQFLKWLLLKTNSAYKVRQEVPLHFYLNLKEINFLGVKLKVPAETEDYLEYTFGKDWKTPIKNFKYTPEYIKVIKGKRPANY